MNVLRWWFNTPLPVMRQAEAAECGLACLAMVATYFGHQTDLASLRTRFPSSLKGATLERIMQMCTQMGLTSRPLRCELEELEALRTPCILHWDMSHFVVLKHVRGAVACLHDPSRGIRQIPLDEVSKHFSGVALEVQPGGNFEKRKLDPAITVRQMLGRVIGFKRSLAEIFVIAVAMQACLIVAPFYMQWVVDVALVAGNTDLLATLTIGFALLLAIQVFLQAFRAWAVMVLSTDLSMQWSNKVFSHLLRLPVSYFERRTLGDVVSRYGSVSAIQRGITTGFLEVVLDGVMAVPVCILMFFYSPKLSLIILGAVTLYFGLRFAAQPILMNINRDTIVLAARQSSHSLETLRGMQTVKICGLEEERRARMLNLTVDTTNQALSGQKLQLCLQLSSALIFGASALWVVWLGANMVLAGSFSVGMLFAFVSYSEMFRGRIGSLIDRVSELRMLRIHGERLADIVNSEPEDAGVEQISPSVVCNDLAISGITFRYAEGERLVLDDVSFHIDEGKCVAIVGPSGSGKTTLLKAILGTVEIGKGEVLVGGISTKQMGIGSFRKRIGTVMQDDCLFLGSVLDNITLFDPRPDISWAQRCAETAAIATDIREMPMGYNSLIGDMGSGLSGGQRQRLLIARALYRRPQLLFLDEATSHLDINTEKQVAANIRALSITRLVIAHRLETIRTSDRVIEIRDGRICHDVPTNQWRPSEPPGRAYAQQHLQA